MPAPQQSPLPPLEGTKSPQDEIMMEMVDQENCSYGVEDGDDHRWTARDRAVVARMVQYQE